MSRAAFRAAAVLAAVLAGRAAAQTPCDEDPATLAARADARLLESADAAAIEEAREAYRRAAVQEPSVLRSLRAADLASIAGDEDEALRFLEEVSRVAGELLAPWDWLDLARQSEARGDRRVAIRQYASALTALNRRGDGAPGWIGDRIRRLDVELEAGAMPVPGYMPPTPEARAAFDEARRLLEAGKRAEAREGFRRALRRSPGYVEAALALGSLEARTGRTSEAVAAYRTALAADPDRVEALLSLANLLWEEPDRQAKEESLALLDRASSLRPDLPRLLKESAQRWAAWGDAPRALARLDEYRRRVPEATARETDALRERLAASVSHAAAAAAPSLPDLASPALPPFQLAQVYARRGDAASLDAALELLADAERLDPRFARAPELAATIHERRGDARQAEAALLRALRADPTRATVHERLALLLSGEPGREADAESAWSGAERAGSREALFELAQRARSRGDAARARLLYRRYLDESPDGPHAEEARAVAASFDRTERSVRRGLLWGAGAAAALVLALLVRLRAGLTLEEWLARDPAAARELRPFVGRLRHEAFKHGGLLLRDAAARLESEDHALRRETAELLLSRLFGAERDVSMRGLAVEASRALADVEALARARGVRVNLRHKDPLLAPVFGALARLRRARPVLARIARGSGGARTARRASVLLGRALAALSAERAQKLGSVLDAAASTPVRVADLQRLLADVCRETAGPLVAPRLEALGELSADRPLPAVRVPRADFETVWRNLFANALAAGAETRPGVAPRLGLSASHERDPVTGQSLLRLVFADDVPRPLTNEMIKGRAAERGLGVVADLVRTHEGSIAVGPPPEGSDGYTKGIVITLPALEDAA